MIASDGVFEFLTNQSVADMVAKYPDPLEACKKVVQDSYDLWLQYEVRTDDITIICIYIGESAADADAVFEKQGSPALSVACHKQNSLPRLRLSQQVMFQLMKLFRPLARTP